MRRNHILILCAALIATLPLFIFGPSCGHDIDFHIQSWLDAAQQLRHGTLQPHWIFSGAFNAGEPRFIFYPPFSWTIGALLSFIFPAPSLPAVYTFIALAAAGLAMHRLARHFVSANTALLVSTIYVVNPYMLFTAYERTAYAELLAAAWLPLLFLAALRAKPTIRGLALPIALLWLTNAPAAVMGCYTLALIMAVRLAIALKERLPFRAEERKWKKIDAEAPSQYHALSATTELFPQRSEDVPWYALSSRNGSVPLLQPDPLTLALTSIAGTLLGLALPAFYLIPAAYERRFVQIKMALISGMRFQDNFLFGHTGNSAHDTVLAQASLLSVGLIFLTFVLTFATFMTAVAGRRDPNAPREDIVSPATSISLALITVCIGFLVSAQSTPLWNHVPELAFLQFPWRFLAIIGVVLALSLAFPIAKSNPRTKVAIPIALILTLALAWFGIHSFRQPCDIGDTPTDRAAAFRANQGVPPTDEYTPGTSDNDVIRADDPPFWFSTNPAAFAPGTTPNPVGITQSTTPESTASIPAPPNTPPFRTDLKFTAPSAGFLILNLRDYPNWDIAINATHPAHIPREDGLIAVPIAAGPSAIHINWRRSLDQQLGLLISLIAVAIFLWLTGRASSRRIKA